MYRNLWNWLRVVLRYSGKKRFKSEELLTLMRVMESEARLDEPIKDK